MPASRPRGSARRHRRCSRAPPPAVGRWPEGRAGTIVLRPIGLTFDLDGVAKGWLADRAVRRLAAHPSAVVDADGDIAIRSRALAGGCGFGDRRTRGRRGSTLVLRPARPERGSSDLRPRDVRDIGPPMDEQAVGRRTTSSIRGPVAQPRPIVVQATVLAGSAREAEAIAKTAVIVGSEAALERLERPGDPRRGPPHRSTDEVLAPRPPRALLA